jgi:hypothetical protein
MRDRVAVEDHFDGTAQTGDREFAVQTWERLAQPPPSTRGEDEQKSSQQNDQKSLQRVSSQADLAAS